LTATLKQIAALVHRESGIVVRDSQLNGLRAALGRVEPANAPHDFLRRAADPIEGSAHIARLLDELTVKETFFLRERDQLNKIDWQKLYERAWNQGSGSVRIWSAGCATGEEAYTLAVLAWEAAGSARPPVRILATDISEAALARARAGHYRPRSTRELEPSLRQRYFREDDDRLVADERLRSLVTFARHNLVRDPIPPSGEERFDLILCRNVLIYFDSPTAARVVGALEAALAPSGTLILGAADALGRTTRHLHPLAADRAATARPARVSGSLSRSPHSLPEIRPREAASAELRAPPRAETADDVIARTSRLLAADPFNASAHLLEGLARLASGDAHAAVGALRKALYVDPRLGIAAFALGRAYESIGDRAAARRSYDQVLRTCDARGDVAKLRPEQIDLGDVVAAARARLDALESDHGDARIEPSRTRDP
jgi:chemotaxis protein methyltransferase CheR